MGGGGVGKHNSLLWQIITPLKGASRRNWGEGGLSEERILHTCPFFKEKERKNDRQKQE